MSTNRRKDRMARSAGRPLADEVLLRDADESDLPGFFEHQFDPEATHMAGFPSRERGAFMAHWSKILQNESVVKKTILYGGEVAGNIVSFLDSGERDVGYWIGREFWGRGVATRALAAFLRLEVRRPLYAHVALHNAASIRVLQKCGFHISHEEEEDLILKLSADETIQQGTAERSTG
jgi:RimJ/RimL family protein N-acetyltransferase